MHLSASKISVLAASKAFHYSCPKDIQIFTPQAEITYASRCITESSEKQLQHLPWCPLLLQLHSHYTVSVARHTHTLWKTYLLKLSVWDSSHRQHQATAAGSAAPGKAENWHLHFYMGSNAHWLMLPLAERAKFLGEVGCILQEAAFAKFLITTIHRSLKSHSLLQRSVFPASPLQCTITDTPARWGQRTL